MLVSTIVVGDLTLAEGSEDEYKTLCERIPEIFKIENYSVIIENPNLRFLSFKRNGELVGGVVYLITKHRPDPEDFPSPRLIFFPAIEGHVLGILPEYRNMGLGTEALNLRDDFVKNKHDAVLIATKAVDGGIEAWFKKRGYHRSDSFGTLVKIFPDKYEQKLREEGLI
jgi:GNAT superfamily N-acetyltransferase